MPNRGMEADMWMYGEVVDGSGMIVVRAELDIVQRGDLAALHDAVLARFHRENPDTSLLTEIGQAGFTLRFGRV
jgi:hypothetical protein